MIESASLRRLRPACERGRIDSIQCRRRPLPALDTQSETFRTLQLSYRHNPLIESFFFAGASGVCSFPLASSEGSRHQRRTARRIFISFKIRLSQASRRTDSTRGSNFQFTSLRYSRISDSDLIHIPEVFVKFVPDRRNRARLNPKAVCNCSVCLKC